MELGSRPSSRDDQEKNNLGNHVQGVQGPRLEGGAAVFDQERQDRPHGHAQGLGSEKAQTEYKLILYGNAPSFYKTAIEKSLNFPILLDTIGRAGCRELSIALRYLKI
jgi:hypothetical protein